MGLEKKEWEISHVMSSKDADAIGRVSYSAEEIRPPEISRRLALFYS